MRRLRLPAAAAQLEAFGVLAEKTIMTHEELVQLADLNFWEAYRDMTRRSQAGVLWEENGLLLHAGGHPTRAIINGAKRTDVSLPAGEVLARADAFFRARGHGYTVTIRAHADQDLEQAVCAAGFTLALELPVLVVDHRVADRAAPTGALIRRVNTETEVRDFVVVATKAFEIHPEIQRMVDSVFAKPCSLLVPHIAGFVAYLAGVPVAAAMTMVSYGVAFVGWVSTRKAFRGRGLGEATTRTATNAGFDLGARLASLQATPLGEPLYRRMGYVEISRYREYTAPLQESARSGGEAPICTEQSSGADAQ